MKKIDLHRYWYDFLTTLVASFCVLVDLLSKVLTDGKTFDVIGEFLTFTSTHNDGAAYGSFGGKTVFLIVITIVILLVILAYNHFHKKKTVFYSISLGLIVGGAIGNLFDRLSFGYVRDFIKFSFFSFNCNFADICLTFGIVLFMIYLIFFDKREKDGNNG